MTEKEYLKEIQWRDQRCFDLEQRLAKERDTNHRLIQELARKTGLTETAARIRFLGTTKKD